MSVETVSDKTLAEQLIVRQEQEYLLTLNAVSLQYSNTPVLNNISFGIKKGQIGCILGPSGSGKTSLLRAIAGFMPVSQGEISIDGNVVSSVSRSLAPSVRSVGLVFQDFALFPHMTVAQNIAFGLHKLDAKTQHGRVQQYMKIMGIEAFANAYPADLSGGQQQRVAIARAIAPQPDLLLMDEAFSSLDPGLREQIAQDVRSIVKSLGLTAVLVTHDQTEAFAFADCVAVVANHELQQFSSAYALYHQPETYFVANFIGESAFIRGTIENSPKGLVAQTALGTLVLNSEQTQAYQLAEQQIVRILLRPDDLIHDDSSPTKAIILSKHFRGAFIRYQLSLPATNESILCFAPSHHNHEVGEAFGISAKVEHVICFP